MTFLNRLNKLQQIVAYLSAAYVAYTVLVWFAGLFGSSWAHYLRYNVKPISIWFQLVVVPLLLISTSDHVLRIYRLNKGFGLISGIAIMIGVVCLFSIMYQMGVDVCTGGWAIHQSLVTLLNSPDATHCQFTTLTSLVASDVERLVGVFLFGVWIAAIADYLMSIRIAQANEPVTVTESVKAVIR